MDNLFLEEFAEKIDPKTIKEIQIYDKSTTFQNNNIIDSIDSIDEYNINTEAIIHKQENISEDSNGPKIYDISKLFTKDINYKNILLSNIEHTNHDKTGNKMVYHLNEEYSNISNFRNVIGFRLSECIINFPLYNINYEEDRILYNDLNLSNVLVNIPIGLYTIHALLASINNDLSGTGSFSLVPNENKIKWTASVSPSSTLLYHKPNGLLTKLGYSDSQLNNKNYLNASSTLIAAHSPNLLKGTFLDIVIDEIPTEACKQVCMGKNIISRIPLKTESDGSDIIYYDNKQFNCNYKCNNLFYPKNFNHLTISLFLDNKEHTFDNLDYSFEFELTILNRN